MKYRFVEMCNFFQQTYLFPMFKFFSSIISVEPVYISKH